ncbi:MAG: hypothetical protein ACLUVG_06470 [Phocaeicola vulgatus]
MTNFSPKRALIGEGCWWFNAQDGDNSKYKHFQGDKRFAMNDFKEAFTVSVTDALDSHCNTLDLRMPFTVQILDRRAAGPSSAFYNFRRLSSLSGLYKGGARPQNVDFVSFMEKLWCGCIA